MRRPRLAPRPAAVIPSPVQLGGKADPDKIERSIEDVAAAVGRLASERRPIEVDLAIGVNRINHALGRPPLGVVVVPRYADPAFAWSYDWTQPDNPHPERQAWLDVIGSPMPARLFFL